MDASTPNPVDAMTPAVLVALTLAPVDLRSLAGWLRSTRARPRELTWDTIPMLMTMFARSTAAKSFDPATLRSRAEELVARAHNGGIGALAIHRAHYPRLLAQIPDPPPVLWVRGAASVLETPSVAIVGSRAASSASLDISRTLGRELAARGLTVVSGLARGVDGAAHAGALEVGRTVAVLAGGVDRVYPPEHGGLADRIASSGAVLSEHPPGTPSRRQHFPRRNRIISGLAGGVVIVEAGEKSGALITAREALDQGREVMVVPGLVTSGRNRGGHALLKDGAALVENAGDIVDVLEAANWRMHPRGQRTRAVGAEPIAFCPAGSETGEDLRERIVGAGPPDGWRAGEELELDELAVLMAEEPPTLLARLLEWELAGLVRRTPAGRFVRRS